MKTAYDLYDAAFDRTLDHTARTVRYLQDYADGAFGLTVSAETCQAILDRMAEADAHFDEVGPSADGIYQMLEKPLSEITL